MREIAERIYGSAVLKRRAKLSTLLRHFVEHDAEPGQLTSMGIMLALRFDSPETVRIQCARLRAALRYYFLYCRAGVDEAQQLDLPEASVDSTETHDHHRHYKLVMGANLHKMRGAEEFWRAHFMVRRAGDSMFGTTIVFTEPLAFRDTKQRFFIRHLDVNDHEESPSHAVDPVAELIRKVPWIKKHNVVVSRGYVPGGEVIGKDRLREWLTRHAEWVKHSGGRVEAPSPFVREEVSRKVPDINALRNSHCVLLGSSRTNWVIRYLQHEANDLLQLRIEPDGIVVANCPPPEYRLLEKRLMELKSRDISEQDLRKMIQRRKNKVYLKEDWSKLSFALVSRVFDRSHGEARAVLTVLAANQGRGVQALGEHILVEDDQMDEVLRVFGITGALPRAFQMLFAVVLKDEEAGYSKLGCRPLMYREISRRSSV
jgi:hypothetical protein